jgi:hypothetical protein
MTCLLSAQVRFRTAQVKTACSKHASLGLNQGFVCGNKLQLQTLNGCFMESSASLTPQSRLNSKFSSKTMTEQHMNSFERFSEFWHVSDTHLPPTFSAVRGRNAVARRRRLLETV